MRQIPAACITLIQQFEGFRSLPYQDSGGTWTIGYGHTKNVGANDAPISNAQALTWLQQDTLEAGALVERYIFITLNENQFSALVSLVFNLGPAPLYKTLGIQLNAGNYQNAAQEFPRWVMCQGTPNLGLMRRRLAEKNLFLTPIENI